VSRFGYVLEKYLFKKDLKKFYVPLTWGEFLFYFLVITMLFVNFKATLLVFVVFFFCMIGNDVGQLDPTSFC
jgi:hypothetical protein